MLKVESEAKREGKEKERRDYGMRVFCYLFFFRLLILFYISILDVLFSSTLLHFFLF